MKKTYLEALVEISRMCQNRTLQNLFFCEELISEKRGLFGKNEFWSGETKLKHVG